MSAQDDITAALSALNPWWQPGWTPEPTGYLHRRDLHGVLCSRLADDAFRRATLLLGPRQVGKSTLLRQIVRTFQEEGWPKGNITFVDFYDDRVRALPELLSPASVAEHVPPGSEPDVPRILLLDEIHYARDWAAWLKRAVDEDRAKPRSMLRILGTDSAASVLSHGSVEAGQGRWNEVRILGLTFSEYLRFLSAPSAEGDKTEIPEEVLRRRPAELDRFLAKGGFPEHVEREPSEDLRRQMREDVEGKAIRRDLLSRRPNGEGADRIDVDRIRRLFVYLAQDSGAILKIKDRADDLEANRATISDWIQLLEDACLIHRVQPFHPARREKLPRASSRLASKPKVYVAEHGLIPAFVLSIQPMAQTLVRARTIETAVLRHLIDLVGDREAVRYYRRDDDIEVDFVIPHDGGTIAVEVSMSESVDRRKVGRLVRAASEIGAERAVLIYGGVTQRVEGECWLLPLHRFLLRPRLLFEGSTA